MYHKFYIHKGALCTYWGSVIAVILNISFLFFFFGQSYIFSALGFVLFFIKALMFVNHKRDCINRPMFKSVL